MVLGLKFQLLQAQNKAQWKLLNKEKKELKMMLNKQLYMDMGNINLPAKKLEPLQNKFLNPLILMEMELWIYLNLMKHINGIFICHMGTS